MDKKKVRNILLVSSLIVLIFIAISQKIEAYHEFIMASLFCLVGIKSILDFIFDFPMSVGFSHLFSSMDKKNIIARRLALVGSGIFISAGIAIIYDLL